ncbi:hypothetical protein AB6T38_08245 [Aliiglaciecola sp. SL4]|uniref:hypothetical protein n=1 Tax=Aliiglaciecola sp. SL4 TaxID=3239806 RepID=UPI00355C2AA4
MKSYYLLSILRSFCLLTVLFGPASFHSYAKDSYQINANLEESIRWYTGETGKVDDPKTKTALGRLNRIERLNR